MHGLSKKEMELVMKMDTHSLTPTQIRLVKTIHSLVAHVLAAEEESEYFEASAELFKKSAELVKHASFARDHKNMTYGTQALEFAVDSLNECMDEDKVQNLDN